MHRHDHKNGHHGHDRAGTGGADTPAKALAIAIAINLLLTAGQIVAGTLAGSLALIADAMHNFSDALALILAFAARRIAARPATSDMTFGWRRAEPVAALMNLTALFVIGLFLATEAVIRLFDPDTVAGGWVMGVAGLALAIDLGTVWLLARWSRGNMNVRAAFLHNMADAAASVAVILSGAAILYFGWIWVDAAITLLIAAYVIAHGALEAGPAARLLMAGAPRDLTLEQVVAAVGEVDGVRAVHHAHLWQIDEGERSFDAHLDVDDAVLSALDPVRAAVRRVLAERFDVHHATLELHVAGHARGADDRQVLGPH